MSKLRQLKSARMRFGLATDFGACGNPHHAAAWREMYYLVTEAGLMPMGAKVLRKENELGTIAEGKLAGIMVVDGSFLENIADMCLVKHIL